MCIDARICLCLLYWNLRVLCLGVIKLLKVENTPSIPKESTLGNILDKWAKHRGGSMTKKDMIDILL